MGEVAGLGAARSLAEDPMDVGRRQWTAAGWGDDAGPGHYVGSLVRVQQLVLGQLDKTLAPFQLRYARYECMMILLFSADHQLPITRLAGKLQVHSASMTTVLRRLEEQRMIERRENVDDGRSSLAVLTAMGRTVALGATRAVRDQVFSVPLLPDAQADELYELLRIQRSSLGDFPTGASGDASAPGGHYDPIEAGRLDWIRAGWDKSAKSMALASSIFRVHQVAINRLDQCLSRLDLSFARFEALMILHFARDGSLPMGKLADRLQVHPASVTNVVKRLEKQGLLSRVANPADRRGSFAVLEPRGEEVLQEARTLISRDVLHDLGLDQCQIDRGYILLKEIRRAAGDFGG